MGKRTLGRSLWVVIALLVAVSAWGIAAAQDNANQAATFLGIGVNTVENGVEVTDVAPDSPAAAAGLEVGDVITAINDESVTAATIREILATFAVGDEINLSVLRGDETVQLTATLASRPERSVSHDFQLELPQFTERPLLGVRLEDTEDGVVIREVVAESPAAKAGLQVDDIITQIGDSDIANAAEAVEAVRALSGGDTVSIEVQRGDQTETVEATLEGTPLPWVQDIPFGREFMSLGIQFNAADQTWTIRNLSEGSALYEAGLREGDVIRQFDGAAYDPPGLRRYLRDLKADANVSLAVEREGETQDIAVPRAALAEINAFGMGDGGPQFFGPDGRGFNIPFNLGQMLSGGRLGVQFVTLDEQVAQERDVTLTDGALVTEVIEGSPAAEAGLQADDVITAVNGEPVDAERTLRDRLVAYEPGDTISLAVSRGDETLTIDVTLGQPEMSDMMPFFGDRGFQFFGPNGREFPFPFERQWPEQQPLQSNL